MPDRSIVIEADQASIEQAIDMRGEQKTIAAIELFLVVADPPRFDVARDEKLRVYDAGDTAPLLVQSHVGLEHALPATCEDQLLLLGWANVSAALHRFLGSLVSDLIDTFIGLCSDRTNRKTNFG